MARTNKRHAARAVRKKRSKRKLDRNQRFPRLVVFRSEHHIYAQIIDDQRHETLVAASTISKELKGTVTKTTDKEAAQKVGELLAKKAQEKKIAQVRFDRGSYAFHGRVQALAHAARSGGLKF